MPNIIMADKKGGGYEAADWLDNTKPVGVIMTDKAIDSSDEYKYLLANRFNITEIIMPNAQTIPYNFACNCRNLEKIVAPNATYIEGYGLNYTPLLKKAVFQSVKGLGTVSIGSSGIEEAEFNGTVEANKTGLNGTPFIYSDRLHILVFRGNSVFSMGSSNSLRNTRFASGNGVVYVPQSLLTDYENATNWATYFTNGNQLKSIESTATDPDAPIDLTRYYIDGTPIPNS